MQMQQQDPAKNPDLVEQAKWEQFDRDVPRGLKPGNPWVFRQFPMMLYRADRIPGSGKWATSMSAPRFFGFRDENEWQRALEMAEVFNRGCQRIVHNEAELKEAMEDGTGWRPTHAEAMEFRNKLEDMVAEAAANRAYNDKNMSEKAKAEAAAFEAANFGHQAEIPEKPLPRKGKKVTPKTPAPPSA